MFLSHSTSGWLPIGFSFVLLCARIIATGSVMYAFLLWNLILAFIPYVISYRLYNNRFIENKLKLVATIFVWLLFIPNSFYILTDLSHLDEKPPPQNGLISCCCCLFPGTV
jgi:uncharacterized membrane protein